MFSAKINTVPSPTVDITIIISIQNAFVMYLFQKQNIILEYIKLNVYIVEVL